MGNKTSTTVGVDQHYSSPTNKQSTSLAFQQASLSSSSKESFEIILLGKLREVVKEHEHLRNKITDLTSTDNSNGSSTTSSSNTPRHHSARNVSESGFDNSPSASLGVSPSLNRVHRKSAPIPFIPTNSTSSLSLSPLQYTRHSDHSDDDTHRDAYTYSQTQDEDEYYDDDTFHSSASIHNLFHQKLSEYEDSDLTSTTSTTSTSTTTDKKKKNRLSKVFKALTDKRKEIKQKRKDKKIKKKKETAKIEVEKVIYTQRDNTESFEYLLSYQQAIRDLEYSRAQIRREIRRIDPKGYYTLIRIRAIYEEQQGKTKGTTGNTLRRITRPFSRRLSSAGPVSAKDLAIEEVRSVRELGLDVSFDVDSLGLNDSDKKALTKELSIKAEVPTDLSEDQASIKKLMLLWVNTCLMYYATLEHIPSFEIEWNVSHVQKVYYAIMNMYRIPEPISEEVLFQDNGPQSQSPHYIHEAAVFILTMELFKELTAERESYEGLVDYTSFALEYYAVQDEKRELEQAILLTSQQIRTSLTTTHSSHIIQVVSLQSVVRGQIEAEQSVEKKSSTASLQSEVRSCFRCAGLSDELIHLIIQQSIGRTSIGSQNHTKSIEKLGILQAAGRTSLCTRIHNETNLGQIYCLQSVLRKTLCDTSGSRQLAILQSKVKSKPISDLLCSQIGLIASLSSRFRTDLVKSSHLTRYNLVVGLQSDIRRLIVTAYGLDVPLIYNIQAVAAKYLPYKQLADHVQKLVHLQYSVISSNVRTNDSIRRGRLSRIQNQTRFILHSLKRLQDCQSVQIAACRFATVSEIGTKNHSTNSVVSLQSVIRKQLAVQRFSAGRPSIIITQSRCRTTLSTLVIDKNLVDLRLVQSIFRTRLADRESAVERVVQIQGNLGMVLRKGQAEEQLISLLHVSSVIMKENHHSQLYCDLSDCIGAQCTIRSAVGTNMSFDMRSVECIQASIMQNNVEVGVLLAKEAFLVIQSTSRLSIHENVQNLAEYLPNKIHSQTRMSLTDQVNTDWKLLQSVIRQTSVDLVHPGFVSAQILSANRSNELQQFLARNQLLVSKIAQSQVDCIEKDLEACNALQASARSASEDQNVHSVIRIQANARQYSATVEDIIVLQSLIRITRFERQQIYTIQAVSQTGLAQNTSVGDVLSAVQSSARANDIMLLFHSNLKAILQIQALSRRTGICSLESVSDIQAVVQTGLSQYNFDRTLHSIASSCIQIESFERAIRGVTCLQVFISGKQESLELSKLLCISSTSRSHLYDHISRDMARVVTLQSRFRNTLPTHGIHILQATILSSAVTVGFDCLLQVVVESAKVQKQKLHVLSNALCLQSVIRSTSDSCKLQILSSVIQSSLKSFDDRLVNLSLLSAVMQQKILTVLGDEITAIQANVRSKSNYHREESIWSIQAVVRSFDSFENCPVFKLQAQIRKIPLSDTSVLALQSMMRSSRVSKQGLSVMHSVLKMNHAHTKLLKHLRLVDCLTASIVASTMQFEEAVPFIQAVCRFRLSHRYDGKAVTTVASVLSSSTAQGSLNTLRQSLLPVQILSKGNLIRIRVEQYKESSRVLTAIIKRNNLNIRSIEILQSQSRVFQPSYENILVIQSQIRSGRTPDRNRAEYAIIQSVFRRDSIVERSEYCIHQLQTVQAVARTTSSNSENGVVVLQSCISSCRITTILRDRFNLVPQLQAICSRGKSETNVNLLQLISRTRNQVDEFGDRLKAIYLLKPAVRQLESEMRHLEISRVIAIQSEIRSIFVSIFPMGVLQSIITSRGVQQIAGVVRNISQIQAVTRSGRYCAVSVVCLQAVARSAWMSNNKVSAFILAIQSCMRKDSAQVKSVSALQSVCRNNQLMDQIHAIADLQQVISSTTVSDAKCTSDIVALQSYIRSSIFHSTNEILILQATIMHGSVRDSVSLLPISVICSSSAVNCNFTDTMNLVTIVQSVIQTRLAGAFLPIADLHSGVLYWRLRTCVNDVTRIQATSKSIESTHCLENLQAKIRSCETKDSISHVTSIQAYISSGQLECAIDQVIRLQSVLRIVTSSQTTVNNVQAAILTFNTDSANISNAIHSEGRRVLLQADFAKELRDVSIIQALVWHVSYPLASTIDVIKLQAMVRNRLAWCETSILLQSIIRGSIYCLGITQLNDMGDSPALHSIKQVVQGSTSRGDKLSLEQSVTSLQVLLTACAVPQSNVAPVQSCVASVNHNACLRDWKEHISLLQSAVRCGLYYEHHFTSVVQLGALLKRYINKGTACSKVRTIQSVIRQTSFSVDITIGCIQAVVRSNTVDSILSGGAPQLQSIIRRSIASHALHPYVSIIQAVGRRASYIGNQTKLVSALVKAATDQKSLKNSQRSLIKLQSTMHTNLIDAYGSSLRVLQAVVNSRSTADIFTDGVSKIETVIRTSLSDVYNPIPIIQATSRKNDTCISKVIEIEALIAHASVESEFVRNIGDIVRIQNLANNRGTSLTLDLHSVLKIQATILKAANTGIDSRVLRELVSCYSISTQKESDISLISALQSLLVSATAVETELDTVVQLQAILQETSVSKVDEEISSLKRLQSLSKQEVGLDLESYLRIQSACKTQLPDDREKDVSKLKAIVQLQMTEQLHPSVKLLQRAIRSKAQNFTDICSDVLCIQACIVGIVDQNFDNSQIDAVLQQALSKKKYENERNSIEIVQAVCSQPTVNIQQIRSLQAILLRATVSDFEEGYTSELEKLCSVILLQNSTSMSRPNLVQANIRSVLVQDRMLSLATIASTCKQNLTTPRINAIEAIVRLASMLRSKSKGLHCHKQLKSILALQQVVRLVPLEKLHLIVQAIIQTEGRRKEFYMMLQSVSKLQSLIMSAAIPIRLSTQQSGNVHKSIPEDTQIEELEPSWSATKYPVWIDSCIDPIVQLQCALIQVHAGAQSLLIRACQLEIAACVKAANTRETIALLPLSSAAQVCNELEKHEQLYTASRILQALCNRPSQDVPDYVTRLQGVVRSEDNLNEHLEHCIRIQSVIRTRAMIQIQQIDVLSIQAIIRCSFMHRGLDLSLVDRLQAVVRVESTINKDLILITRLGAIVTSQTTYKRYMSKRIGIPPCFRHFMKTGRVRDVIDNKKIILKNIRLYTAKVKLARGKVNVKCIQSAATSNQETEVCSKHMLQVSVIQSSFRTMLNSIESMEQLQTIQKALRTRFQYEASAQEVAFVQAGIRRSDSEQPIQMQATNSIQAIVRAINGTHFDLNSALIIQALLRYNQVEQQHDTLPIQALSTSVIAQQDLSSVASSHQIISSLSRSCLVTQEASKLDIVVVQSTARSILAVTNSIGLSVVHIQGNIRLSLSAKRRVHITIQAAIRSQISPLSNTASVVRIQSLISKSTETNDYDGLPCIQALISRSNVQLQPEYPRSVVVCTRPLFSTMRVSSVQASHVHDMDQVVTISGLIPTSIICARNQEVKDHLCTMQSMITSANQASNLVDLSKAITMKQSASLRQLTIDRNTLEELLSSTRIIQAIISSQRPREALEQDQHQVMLCHMLVQNASYVEPIQNYIYDMIKASAKTSVEQLKLYTRILSRYISTKRSQRGEFWRSKPVTIIPHGWVSVTFASSLLYPIRLLSQKSRLKTTISTNEVNER